LFSARAIFGRRGPLWNWQRQSPKDEELLVTLFDDDEPDLLRRFRDGDRAALDAVYQAYVNTVTRSVVGALRRHGGTGRQSWRTIAGEVPDLVQDVFTRAFEPRTRRRFDGLRQYGPYLGQITRNVVVDHLRKHWRQLSAERDMVLEEITLAPAAEAASPGSGADLRTMTLVRRYVAGLSPDLRRVHEALYVRGLSQREAALALGLGRQVVRSMEAKLRDGLRGALAGIARASESPPESAIVVGRPAGRAAATTSATGDTEKTGSPT